jgi:alcohol dehydrogenase class IV
MGVSQFFMPGKNILGLGALDEGINQIGQMGYKKALIVTDGALSKMGLAKTVADKLAAQGISAEVFDGVQPNPTVGNVNSGLKNSKPRKPISSSLWVVVHRMTVPKALRWLRAMAGKLRITRA